MVVRSPQRQETGVEYRNMWHQLLVVVACATSVNHSAHDEVTTDDFYQSDDKHLMRWTMAEGKLYELNDHGTRLVWWEGYDGSIKFYDGPYGKERLVWWQAADGSTEFYEGPSGDERLVRWESAKGAYTFLYKGSRGYEELVHWKGQDEPEESAEWACPGGYDAFYKGPPGKERLVRWNCLKDDFLPSPAPPAFPTPRKPSVQTRPIEETHPTLQVNASADTKFYDKGEGGGERLVRTEDLRNLSTDNNSLARLEPLLRHMMARLERNPTMRLRKARKRIRRIVWVNTIKDRVAGWLLMCGTSVLVAHCAWRAHQWRSPVVVVAEPLV